MPARSGGSTRPRRRRARAGDARRRLGRWAIRAVPASHSCVEGALLTGVPLGAEDVLAGLPRVGGRPLSCGRRGSGTPREPKGSCMAVIRRSLPGLGAPAVSTRGTASADGSPRYSSLRTRVDREPTRRDPAAHARAVPPYGYGVTDEAPLRRRDAPDQAGDGPHDVPPDPTTAWRRPVPLTAPRDGTPRPVETAAELAEVVARMARRHRPGRRGRRARVRLPLHPARLPGAAAPGRRRHGADRPAAAGRPAHAWTRRSPTASGCCTPPARTWPAWPSWA